ncbi:unnamed protein product [Soboliphyme baturini]|uniref:Uncharacterized protein n=1 Tax=Soboliphyme baturini TaxID=241478 RepID=A0A183IU07_9BILA|nr:unnamed protein product [Soboliphyme baturini]
MRILAKLVQRRLTSIVRYTARPRLTSSPDLKRSEVVDILQPSKPRSTTNRFGIFVDGRTGFPDFCPSSTGFPTTNSNTTSSTTLSVAL